MKQLTTTEFFDTSFADYAGYDNYRNLSNVIDGMKLSQRKVMFTVDKLNITDVKNPVKVESLAPDTAKLTEYLHGSVSLVGVINGIVLPWGIFNNLPLLFSKGNFGKRLNTAPAAPRYIYTCKKPIFDNVFRQEDRIILEQLKFEGKDIEYANYLPIIPFLFCKISEGMGVGFSHIVLPRNPVELIDNIKLMLNGKKPKALTPYSKGFRGTVEKGLENSWIYKGCFTRKNQNTLMVTELPISFDLAGYTKVLNDLEESKTIKGFKDLSDPKKDIFLFEIDVTRDFSSQTDEQIMKALRLIEQISDNITLLDENNIIKEFKSDVEVYEYWFDYRFKKYEERRVEYIRISKEEMKIVKNRLRFILSIIKGDIVVNNKQKTLIETDLTDKKFDLIDDGFDYLLSMPIYSLTKEKAKQLQDDFNNKKQRLEDYEKTDAKTIWSNELEELKKEIQ